MEDVCQAGLTRLRQSRGLRGSSGLGGDYGIGFTGTFLSFRYRVLLGYFRGMFRALWGYSYSIFRALMRSLCVGFIGNLGRSAAPLRLKHLCGLQGRLDVLQPHRAASVALGFRACLAVFRLETSGFVKLWGVWGLGLRV